MKPLEWIGSAKDDLLDLPSDVQNVMGYGLYLAQIGDKYDDAKLSNAHPARPLPNTSSKPY
jgi:phage-related protein